MINNGGMDQVDRTVVRLLSPDARASWSQLGRKIGLSAPAGSRALWHPVRGACLVSSFPHIT